MEEEEPKLNKAFVKRAAKVLTYNERPPNVPTTLGEHIEISLVEFFICNPDSKVDLDIILTETKLKKKEVLPLVEKLLSEGFLTSECNFITGDVPWYTLNMEELANEC